MKKKFKYLMEFLKQFGFDKVTQTYTFYDSGYDWGLQEITGYKDGQLKTIPTSSIVLGLLENFLEEYTNEIEDIVYDHNDNPTRFDVEVEIYPFQNKLIYSNSFVYYYTSESSQSEYDFDDDEDSIVISCREFLESLGNPEDVIIDYDGSGDSGYIESKGKPSNGETVDLPAEIEDICYRELESNFGGWEINEGSNGQIIITNHSIIIDHNWNVEVEDDVTLDIEITEDSFD